MHTLIDALGWAGAALVLGAFAANARGGVRRVRSYQVVNALGALGLGAAAAQHHNWPSVAVNVPWFVIAIVALGRSRASAEAPERR